MLRFTIGIVITGLIASAAAGAPAAPLCNGFKWDASKELALFAQSPSLVPAGKNPSSAPTIAIDHLYELDLTPQTEVTFALAPGKKMLTDGAYAGLVALKLAAPGLYRVSVDVPFWIDVAADGQLVAAKDFQGQHDCNAPHKIVEFDLAAGQLLIIQVSGSVKSTVRLSVTRSPAPKP